MKVKVTRTSRGVNNKYCDCFTADGRHGIVRVDRVPLAAKLVDVPCVLECLKTIDKKTFYKTADICQMLVCTLDGDLYPPLEDQLEQVTQRPSKRKTGTEKRSLFGIME
ncbi:hypothetical protein GDO78_013208, partial [Eleutherodactylus coqui]